MIGQPLRCIQVGSILPALQRANQLMASGHYVDAAGIFGQFSRGALARICIRAVQAQG